MSRTLPVCAVLLVLAPAARPQQDDPKETVIRLTVHPAPSPKPALRYQLLPELRDMNPGNPILGYLKCFSEQAHFFHSKEAEAQREQWLKMPLKGLPVNQLRGYGGVALRRADYAARLTTPDWETLLPAKQEGTLLLIPEVQQMRSLTRALTVRLRGEVADRRFDDAVRTAQTMFALARHVGEHPSPIGNLVGNAMTAITIGPLEEMIQQPGGPNLFWALTDLPSPMIDLRSGLQGERLMVAKEFRLINAGRPMAPTEIQEAVAHLQFLLQMPADQGKTPDVKRWLDERAKDEAHVRAALTRLVESGLPAKVVQEFPPVQVVLLDEKYTLEELRDEATRTMRLPYWQAQAELVRWPVERARVALLTPLTRWTEKVRLAQVRVEQRLALLRYAEALRMHAAANKGRLPQQLSDLKLPLPPDPVTGRPFRYSLEGNTAMIRGTPPPGHDYAAFNIRYAVTIAR